MNRQSRVSVRSVSVLLLMPFVAAPEMALASSVNGPTFDHSAYDSLLKKHVDADGWVNYEGLKRDASRLDAYIKSIADTSIETMGRDAKLAFFINAYNAFTLRLILDYYPVKSIKKIPESKSWKHRRWSIGGKVLSLNDIEHNEIRPVFGEPRIHFALVCAAIGCPKLRNEAFVADRLEEQLADQTRYVHTHDRWFRFDPTGNTVHLTKLYDWYGGDFKKSSGSVIQFVAGHSSALKQAIDSGKKIKIRWLNYDWTLNDKKNRP